MSEEISEKLDKVIILLTKMSESLVNPFSYWTLEEEQYVKEMNEKGVSCFDIAVGIKEKFNVSRSSSAVQARIRIINAPNVAVIDEPPVKSGFKKKKLSEDSSLIMDGIYEDRPF